MTHYTVNKRKNKDHMIVVTDTGQGGCFHKCQSTQHGKSQPRPPDKKKQKALKSERRNELSSFADDMILGTKLMGT